MEKSNYQIKIESNPPCNGFRYKLRVVKKNPNNGSPCEVGEIIEVVRWGTFGCWDKQNRWVDFYSCEGVT